MFEGRAKVPAVDCMNVIAPAVGRTFVDKDFHARGSNGCASIVEWTVDMCIGRELRIESRLAKEIQSDRALGKEFVPEVKREIGVSRGETGNEVILKSLDGSFSKVATMEADWGKFIVNVILIQ